jgi:hypothetical protein
MRKKFWRLWIEWLRDLPVIAGLSIFDRIAGPTPETEADRAREREEAVKVVPLRRTQAKGETPT